MLELNAIYEDKIIERGHNYIHNVIYCLKIDDFLYAEVEGTHRYKTKVNLKTLQGSCSCPYGTDCKHAVATYLAYKNKDYVNAEPFIRHLDTLDKESLIKIIVDSIYRNPKIVLDYDFKTLTKPESFVNSFITDFNYQKLEKAEMIVSSFDFKLLTKMLDFIIQNEDDLCDKIYETNYGGYEDNDVLFDFEICIKEEIIKKITTEAELKKAIALSLNEDIIKNADSFIRFKDTIKKCFSKYDYLSFLLHLKKPNVDEIIENITAKNKNQLYYLPEYNIQLADAIATSINDKKLIFLVAIHNNDYKNILCYFSELNKIIKMGSYHIISTKITDIVRLFMKNKLKAKNIAETLLFPEFINLYDKTQMNYLLTQTDDYEFIKKLIDLDKELTLTLIERLNQLSKKDTEILIKNKKDIFRHQDTEGVVSMLKVLRNMYGDQYIIDIIQINSERFKTSTALKSRLKQEGIFITNLKGIFNIRV